MIIIDQKSQRLHTYTNPWWHTCLLFFKTGISFSSKRIFWTVTWRWPDPVTQHSQTSPVARSKQSPTAQWKDGSFVPRLSKEHVGMFIVLHTHVSGVRAAVSLTHTHTHLLPAVLPLTSTWHLLQSTIQHTNTVPIH